MTSFADYHGTEADGAIIEKETVLEDTSDDRCNVAATDYCVRSVLWRVAGGL